MGICTEGNKEKQANRKPRNSFYRKEGRYTQHHYSLPEVHHLNWPKQLRGYKQPKHTVKITWLRTGVGVWKCVYVWLEKYSVEKFAHTKKCWRILQEVGGHPVREGGDIRQEHFKQRERWWTTPKTNKTQQGRRVRGSRAKGRGNNFIFQTKQEGEEQG